MKIKLLAILFLSIQFFSSCFDTNYKLTDDVEIEALPIVQCFFTNGQPFSILVSKTRNIFNPNDVDTIRIDSIKIHSSNLKEFIFKKLNSYLYQSDSCADVGQYYTLIIYTKDYGTLKSNSYIPAENPTIDTLWYVKTTEGRNFYNLMFEEIKNIENFYEIITIPIVTNPEDSALVYGDSNNYFYRNIASDAPIYKKENFKDYITKTFLLFSDKGFENQTITFPFSIIHKNPFYVIIKNVSKEYYLYKKSISIDVYGGGVVDSELDGLIYMTTFQQNKKIYSNIENGIGIFAGFNSKSHKRVN